MIYITVIELHQRLAGALSLNTLYRMLEERRIPGAIQPSGKGGKWLVPEDALDSIGDKEEAKA
jgi:hypothetical protein